MSDTYNINLVKGSSATYQLNATDSNGSLINLSGFNSRAYVKYKYSDTGILLNLNPVITSAVSGIVTITISGAASSNLPIGQFPFDCEIWMTGSNTDYVCKFIRGFLNVDPEVTY